MRQDRKVDIVAKICEDFLHGDQIKPHLQLMEIETLPSNATAADDNAGLNI